MARKKEDDNVILGSPTKSDINLLASDDKTEKSTKPTITTGLKTINSDDLNSQNYLHQINI
jgi:hypothetical protein